MTMRLRYLRIKRSATAAARGGALVYALAVITVAGITASAAYTAWQKLGEISHTNALRVQSGNLLSQAAAILRIESGDSDSDGVREAAAPLAATPAPAGGGQVPAGSAAPKRDAWGQALGYCSFDNGSTNTSAGRVSGDNPATNASVTLAVLSAGPDKTFQTSCANVRSGTLQGDDGVRTVTNGQILRATSGLAHYLDPAPRQSDADANPGPLLSGAVTLLQDRNMLYHYDDGWWYFNDDMAGPLMLLGDGLYWGWERYAGSAAILSFAGATVPDPSPVGSWSHQAGGYVWTYNSYVPISPSQRYLVEGWMRCTANCASSATTTFVVDELDAGRTRIAGDGAMWHYPVSFGAPAPTTWTRYAFIIGPDGGSKAHAAAARFMTVGYIANSPTGTATMQFNGFRITPLPEYPDKALIVSNAGNVGLGGAPATGAKLDVQGTARVAQLVIAGNNTASTFSNADLVVGSTTVSRHNSSIGIVTAAGSLLLRPGESGGQTYLQVLDGAGNDTAAVQSYHATFSGTSSQGRIEPAGSSFSAGSACTAVGLIGWQSDGTPLNCRGGGPTWQVFGAAAGGGGEVDYKGRAVFTAAQAVGAYVLWTKPAGVSSVTAQIWGAGGGGAGGSLSGSFYVSGAGGGAGEYRRVKIDVSGLSQLAIHVGAGGAAGSSSTSGYGSGGGGGDSSWVKDTALTTTYGESAGGAGGTACGSTSCVPLGGAGGGSAGGDGRNAMHYDANQKYGAGAMGGHSPNGGGGGRGAWVQTGVNTGGNATPGQQPGGGGGGGVYDRNGAPGGDGMVVLWYH